MVAKQTGLLIGTVVVLAVVILILVWGRPLQGPPGPLPPKPKHATGKMKTATGIVSGYEYNAHLDINSIHINSTTAGTLAIDFLPHTAQAVMAIGHAGDLVTVQYVLQPSDEAAGYRLEQITNDASGKTAKLPDLSPPPDIPGPTAENFRLANPILIIDKYGGIVALRSGDSLFHFKPGLVDDIMPLIKNTKTFALMAVRRADNLGFVNVNHDKVFIVLSIIIDNKTFLVR